MFLGFAGDMQRRPQLTNASRRTECFSQDEMATDVDWKAVTEFTIPSEVVEQGRNQSARMHQTESANCERVL
jgi:hypothetical protein